MSTPTNFVTRSQWGSTFDYSSNTRMPATCQGVALHWEGSPMGTFTHDQCDNHVRSIEAYHVKVKGWAGIAYNALVCPHGYIFEGRGIRYRSAANGDVGPNNAWFAVCYLGGKGDPFTDAAKAGYIRAVQWLRANGGAGSKVVGHRDVFSTECPGATIGTWLKATNFSAGTTAPPPAAPVWGQPATWVLGGVSDDVTRLGQRLVVHLGALRLPAPYASGPGPTFTEVDVAAVAAFQKAQGWSGADADGYPGVETFKRLAAEPATAPPAPETVTLEVLFVPMAGYNADTAPGVTRWKANTGGLAALVAKHMPDLVGTTELSNRSIDPMLPLFDSLVKPAGILREPGGTDGRYVYANQATSKHIASGHVAVSNAAELNDDDKQAAWSVRELAGGVRKGLIVMHTENEDGVDRTSGENADHLRVDQTFSALGRALTAMAPYGITADDVIYVGDFNSESMVRDAMVARGWKAIGPGYFTRWDDSAKKTFDWAFIKAGTATFERINHAYGDHTALRITWTPPK